MDATATHRYPPPIVWLAGPLLTVTTWASLASAAVPCVQFDVSYTVGCRDVTPDKFRETNPDEKLVEARFRVSSLIRYDRERDLIQYLYQVVSPEQSLQIVDYSPKTAVATRVAGNVEIKNQRETSSSLGLSAGGSFEHLITADASAANGTKKSSSVTYQLLPPMELVAASGTTRRGSGAYFKLKPSRRSSLEGAKDFVVVLRVPSSWRGDYVHVDCAATARRRTGGSTTSASTCGGARFLVALYVEGDERAKDAAERFVQAERHLRRTASVYRGAIHDRSYPSLAHKVGAKLSVVDPKIPPSWLDQVLASQAGNQSFAFGRHLPEQVRQAVVEYARARQRLHELRTSRHT